MRLSIIVPTSGKRDTLPATIISATSQMRPNDELLVDVNDFPWGNWARQRKMEQACGDALLFQDDDDVYAPGALDIVRRELEAEPCRFHVFRMLYLENEFVLWQDMDVRCGNVASQMICVPNIPDQWGVWGNRYEGDFDFISTTVAKMGPPIWHQEVISLVRHPQLAE